MAFRFRKSIKIAPGVRLNVGKKGGSFTVGKRGSSVNFGSRGVHSNVGIPGTGLSYRSKIAGSTSKTQSRSSATPSSQSNAVHVKISLALKEDGNVIFQDSEGNSLPDDYVRQAKRQNRVSIINWLQENSDEINGEIESLVNIHLTTPPPDTEITFTPLKFTEQEPTPPSKDFSKIKPNKPTLKEYNFGAQNIKFLQKQVDKKNEKRQQKFEYQFKKWEADKADFEANYIIQYEKYLKNFEQYKTRKMNFQQSQVERKKFIEEDRLHDVNAMQSFLEEALQALVWPRETLVSYAIGENGTEVFLDVDLPEIEDMPEQQVRVNKRDLRLTYKDISQTQKRKNYFTHVHAIGFKLIGEVFVALPSITTIVLSAYSQRPSKSTGKTLDEYLYSTKVLREKWESINFQGLELIDLGVCFEEFELRRKSTKTGVFTPIEPFEVGAS